MKNGSAKQIEWAGRIKAERLTEIAAIVEQARAAGGESDPRFGKFLLAQELAEKNESAQFWIDSRDTTPAQIMRELLAADHGNGAPR